MDKKIVMIAAVVFSIVFASQADAAGCKIVAGKTYYTDGVSNFKDAKCQQEMIGAVSSAESSAAVFATAGTGNCRYNSSRMQYTDGVSYFTDIKCLKEALAGEKVEQATIAAASVIQAAQVAAPAMSSAQFTQITQRMDSIERRLSGLQTILAQILGLLAKK